MRGAPRPGGGISNSRCGACSVVLPMRPIVVPPSTDTPFLRRLARKSLGSRPSGAPAEPRVSWASPPAVRAFWRSGWANRRTFAVVATGAASAGAAFAATRRGPVALAAVAAVAGAGPGPGGPPGGVALSRGLGLGGQPAALALAARLAPRARGGVSLRDALQVGVRVRVAVHVLEHDVAAEALG